MDLIYADKNKNDIGVLKDYKLDLAYGSDENDFELTVPMSENVCDEDYYIYIDGTEYGGIIDSIEVSTEDKTIKYKGRTFHGILAEKVISPPSGGDYYTQTADLTQIMSSIISGVSLSSLFEVVSSTTKTVSCSFRYSRAYQGLLKLANDNDYKLGFKYEDGLVKISAVPVVHYDEDSGLDSDRITFDIQRTYNPVNHLICLGQGELRNRQVVNLYANQDGEISETQYYTGVEEIVEVFDYPNAESLYELTEAGKKKLKEYNTSSIEMSLGENYEFDIGDIVTVTDTFTGIAVTRRISKKIVTINKGNFKINYEVGE